MNNDIPHSHCPYGHEHPQPFEQDGVEYCGCCYFMHNETLTPMVLCTADTCLEMG